MCNECEPTPKLKTECSIYCEEQGGCRNCCGDLGEPETESEPIPWDDLD